jgi:hypothetical protein
MAGDDATGKLLQAWNESTDALIDAIRTANDRNHRFATALIEEAQEAQRVGVELTKKWASAPFDFFGLYGSMVESTTKAQGRALDVTRQWFGEMADVQKETRDTMQRMYGAGRTAGEASIEAARGVLTRATEAVQSAATGNGRSAPATREIAKTEKPPASV